MNQAQTFEFLRRRVYEELEPEVARLQREIDERGRLVGDLAELLGRTSPHVWDRAAYEVLLCRAKEVRDADAK